MNSGLDALTKNPTNPALRILSTITAVGTLFLIFVGALVNSTGSGLAVPDWPLSYGTFFPPLVGGVFYEHSHRMVASVVGLLMLLLVIGLSLKEKRRWVRNLGFFALGAVVLQGVLGGITVLFFLPTVVSVFHGVLAQTFFVLTIAIAYSQSRERWDRENFRSQNYDPTIIRLSLLLLLLIYVQLIIAAFMRHTHSGLAIPDFPRMEVCWWPFNKNMLETINHWRFMADLKPVFMWQVVLHFVHRLGAAIIAAVVIYLTFQTFKYYRSDKKNFRTILNLDTLIVLQIFLGIETVLSWKSPWITSLHVVNGAAILGASVLFVLRILPTGLAELKRLLAK